MAELFLPLAATVALLSAFGGGAAGGQAEVVPALYVFGDSTVDVGNNNYLPGKGAKANYPPYGVDYPGGVPTGRFTNGYNLADFLAKKLGFEESPPPALSISNASQESKGVNYASGSSGVLDTTGRSVSLSLNEQVALFRTTVERLAEAAGGRRAARARLGRSFFAFSTANNDIFASSPNVTRDGGGEFISTLTFTFRDQLKEIYRLGGRRFGIFGVGDLGCAPAVKSSTGRCVEGLNALARSFNGAMQDALQELRSATTASADQILYSYVHSREISSAIAANSSRFGFKEAGRICCGDAETPCTPDAGYCSDRREYMSWDGLHPTEAAYNVSLAFAYDGSTEFVAPINFRQLATWSTIDGTAAY